MSGIILAAIRTGAKVAAAAVVAWLVGFGVELPVDTPAILTAVLAGVAIAAYTALQRFLESREGTGLLARVARLLGRLMQLGIGGRQPVYVAGDERLRVVAADGTLRPPR